MSRLRWVNALDHGNSRGTTTRSNDNIYQAFDQFAESFLSVTNEERDEIIQQVGRRGCRLWGRARTDGENSRLEDYYADYAQSDSDERTGQMPWPIRIVPIMLMVKNSSQ